MSFRIVNPGALGKPRGWNHGLLAPAWGRLLLVAGQTDRDADGKIRGSTFVEQFRGALVNVLAVVREAGGAAGDIGRLTVYVTDLAAYRASRRPLGEAYRELMGRHYPAMAVLEVTGLVDEGAVVEIEATAVLPPGERPVRDA
ncbi:MAG: RidA family protein [Candidatus Palauibacterales bacterium]|nr:RidA family protein [Candidatus Palauibacterales bacterium]MDP2528846.1 RidA family protein [Candidatus Palauibacterales bacterium]